MLFTAPSFLFVFLPVVLLLHLIPRPVWRNSLLLVASLVFYAFNFYLVRRLNFLAGGKD